MASYYSAKTHRLAYARLRALADGAEPEHRNAGICNDLHRKAFKPYGPNGYGYCAELFERMGLPRHDPIGDYYTARMPTDFDLWAGWHGEKRRELAAKMADFIMENYL